MALALAEGNTTSDSTNCLSAMDSYQGDTCTSFEYKKHSKRRRNKHAISNMDKHHRIAKYLGHERRKMNSRGEQTQILTCSKKDSSSQTDLKIPHCVSSLLSKSNAAAATDIEQKILEIFEEQDLLQNASDNDLLKDENVSKAYSDDSLSKNTNLDVGAEKMDEPKADKYDFEMDDTRLSG